MTNDYGPSLSAWSIHPLFAILATLLVAIAMTIGQLDGLPRMDGDLPYPGIERDIERDIAAVQDSLAGVAAPTDHFRTPGALLLLTPTLALPPDYLTWSAAIIGWLSLGLMVAALARINSAKSLVVGVLLATSGAYSQTVLHGSLFLVVGALVVWSWTEMTRGSDLIAGFLLGIAVTLRPWLGLVVVGALVLRQWRIVISAVITVGVGSALGLILFSEVAATSVIESGRLAIERWVPATHNGSLAALIPGSPSGGSRTWGFDRIGNLGRRISGHQI